MPAPPYAVSCPGCGGPAEFKVAARWSDGRTEELKTYALCCERCLPAAYRASLARHADCRRAAGELLDPPGIYRRVAGQLDRQLERLPDLESALTTA